MTSAIRARREAEDGFTLIELLVVVIIIGILAAIAIPAFLNQRERAWQSELTSTVRNVALEVEAEATIFGGDYTDVAGDTTTTFPGFVQEQLEALQGAADSPVAFDEANDWEAEQSFFAICMTHSQLVSGSGTAATPTGSVTYVSNTGGLGEFVESDCAADLTP